MWSMMVEEAAIEYVGKVKELLASSSLSFRNATSNEVPDKAGVYLILNEHGKVVYVGRTKNLRRRLLGDHRRGNVRGSQFRKALMHNHGFENEEQVSKYVEQCAFKFNEIDDAEERIRLEHFATAVLSPILNLKLKQ